MDEADLYFYIEGQVSKIDQKSIEKHLLGCGHCQEKLASIMDDLPQPMAEREATLSEASDFDIDQMLSKILVDFRSGN